MAQPRTTSRDIEARIGSGASIRGRIEGEGDLIVEGRVEGPVALRGDLTIAEGASVSSEAVEAHAVTVAGTLEGDVIATGAVRLGASARVRGDLRGSAVVIADGARFAGRLDCQFDLPQELSGSSAGESRQRGPARR
jgi:cytoskeletal protein CcmA (bactofilin family)